MKVFQPTPDIAICCVKEELVQFCDTKKSLFINKHFLKIKENLQKADWLSTFLWCSGEISIASHRAGTSNLLDCSVGGK